MDIEPTDVPSIEGDRHPVGGAMPFAFDLVEEPYHAARDRITAEFERRYLSWVVSRAEGNMSKAARIAGIDRTTIYRLMEKHGLHRAALVNNE
jgi:transcriptional regulator of acetoin/glycerol metabolism